jgi:hypothetical protein
MSGYTPALVKRYWSVVAQLGCAVTLDTYQPHITIHHCHGGSMAERGFGRSAGRKTSWWLVIGLHRDLHVGAGGIDGPYRIPVEEWEARHGRQADMIDELVRRTGIDVWALARDEEKGMCPRRAA